MLNVWPCLFSLPFFPSPLSCPLLALVSHFLSLFTLQKVRQIPGGLQHGRRPARLPEGLHRPPAQEARHPPTVGWL